MKWHRFRFSKTLWIGLLILSNSSLASLSFKEAIDLAFQNNEDILIQKERIQKAHYTHKKAQGAHYPTLTGSSSLTRSRAETSITETYSTTKTYGVTLATDIYSGNATNLAVKQAIIKKRQGRTSLKQIKLGLLRKLRESFARALYAQKYVKLSRRILKRKRDNYDFFRLRYPGGLEPLWAFKQAKTEYKEAQWELKEAEKDKELTLKTLYLHIGLPFPEKNRLSLKGSFKLFKL
ncbi:MAG: TolC family protein, partial [Bdellovibrionota bacterium]|nr:TolC family protein [Bdellovibrionota bacterium]